MYTHKIGALGAMLDCFPESQILAIRGEPDGPGQCDWGMEALKSRLHRESVLFDCL